jgi:hypothetical protein
MGTKMCVNPKTLKKSTGYWRRAWKRVESNLIKLNLGSFCFLFAIYENFLKKIV